MASSHLRLRSETLPLSLLVMQTMRKLWRAFDPRASRVAHLSGTSRFNLLFMRRTNFLSLSLFIVGVLIKLLWNWLSR